MSDTVIDYEKLVADYENSLLNTLRGHLPSETYLETWVPDADPVRGILNLVEAAQAAGMDSVAVRVQTATLTTDGLDTIRAMVADVGKLVTEEQGSAVLLTVTELQG